MENLEQKEVSQSENGGDNGKVEKKYLANTQRLLALYQGGEVFKTSKLANDAATEVMDELLEEEIKEAKENFKVKAKGLLKSKVEFDKFVIAKQKELDAAILNRKKEFNKEMDNVFGLLKNIDQLKVDYQTSLGGGSTEVVNTTVENENTPE